MGGNMPQYLGCGEYFCFNTKRIKLILQQVETGKVTEKKI